MLRLAKIPYLVALKSMAPALAFTITSLLVLMLSVPSAAQPFHRLIGGAADERGQTIVPLSNGKYLINGATTSFGQGSADAMCGLLDLSGNLLWAKVYGASSFDNSEYAVEALDHGFVFTGRTDINGNSDVLLFKTDSTGALSWTKTIGGAGNDGAAHIIRTYDGGFALTGATQSMGSSLDDVLLIHTNANGDTVFSKGYGLPETEIGLTVAQTRDSGFVIAGKQVFLVNGVQQGDAFVIKTDSLGIIQWSNFYRDTLWEELVGIAQTADGGYIACGNTFMYGAGRYDFLLMRLDSIGHVVWSKYYGGPDDDASYAVISNVDGTFVLSGYSKSLGYGHRLQGDPLVNVLLVKVDANGDTLWSRAYGDGLQDEAYRCNAVPDGGYVISGFTESFTPQLLSQMLFIHTDSMGFSGCHEQTVAPQTGNAPYLASPVSFTMTSGIPVTVVASYVEQPAVVVADDACLLTGVQTALSRKRLMLYPNPSFDDVYIDGIEERDYPLQIKLTDLSGRVVLEEELMGNQPIRIGSLQSGIYFLEAETTRHDILTGSLIRE